MKRIISFFLTTALMLTFLTGCGADDRLLYNNIDLSEYVELGDYLNIEIDTTSEDYLQTYAKILKSDMDNYNLYNNITEGTVVNGDIVNLDYEGKLDGVAFDGGTAKGAELDIGSKTFIDDFEEELIGVAVGETKDVTATFPTPYQNNPDLAGKEAIFTCKINYILRPFTEAEAFEKLGFASEKEYIENINKRAIDVYILNTVCGNAKIKDYPQKDQEKLAEAIFEHTESVYQTQYKRDFTQLLQYNGLSVDQYKKDASIQMMNTNMIMYYILDKEGLEIYKSTVESQGVDNAVIAESYAVNEIVVKYLLDNAKIK